MEGEFKLSAEEAGNSSKECLLSEVRDINKKIREMNIEVKDREVRRADVS
jgi:hypothetical protein